MDFAILSNGIVENVIVADDADVVRLFFPDREVVEIAEETGCAFIGEPFVAGKFRSPAPYQSWVWDTDKWTAPVPMPTDGKPYQWDEAAGLWTLMPPPFPSWTLNEDGNYVAPVPYPTDGGRYLWGEATLSWLPLPEPKDEVV